MKKLTRASIALGLAVSVSGCAKRPEEISAIQMESRPYLNMDCRNLAITESSLRSELHRLSEAQNYAANSDAISIILLGVPLSFMTGNDKEAQISVTKGKLDAIEFVQARNYC